MPIFLVPIIFISTFPGIYDLTVLPKVFLTVTFSGAILIWLSAKKKFEINIYSSLLVVGFLVIVFSAIANKMSIFNAFAGNYSRYWGLGTYIALSILFLYSSQFESKQTREFIKSLAIVVSGVLIYGSLQLFNLDPLNWKKTFDGIILTLGNPNFAAALIGMLTALPISKIIEAKNSKAKFSQIGVLIGLIILGVFTKSFQFYFIAIASILVFFIIRFSINSTSKELRLRNIFGVISLLGFLSFIGMLLIPQKVFELSRIVNFKLRFFYFEDGLRTFKDHVIFGVGPDNFVNYAQFYRTKEQAFTEGASTIPDRAHNVLIDFLANTGIFSAAIWLLFIIVITVVMFRNISTKKILIEDRNKYALISAIWITYLLQTQFSTDFILLAVLGYLSAGIIISYSKPKNYIIINKTFQNYIGVTAGSVFLILSLFVFGKSVYLDGLTHRLMNQQIIELDKLNQFIENQSQNKPLEILGVRLIQSPDGCKYLPPLIEKMKDNTYRSGQAYYLDSVCFNFQSDYKNQVNSINKALSYDPYNTNYLSVQIKGLFALKEFDKLNESLALYKELNGQDPEILEILN